MQLKQVPILSTIFLLSLGHSSQCLHVWERERGVRFCESRKEEGIRQKKKCRMQLLITSEQKGTFLHSRHNSKSRHFQQNAETSLTNNSAQLADAI